MIRSTQNNPLIFTKENCAPQHLFLPYKSLLQIKKNFSPLLPPIIPVTSANCRQTNLSSYNRYGSIHLSLSLVTRNPRVCLISNASIISGKSFWKEGETIFWEIADVRPRCERVRRYYEINLVIAWPRKKSGRSVLIKELGASAAPCQRLAGFPPFLSLFFSFFPPLFLSPPLSPSSIRDRYRLRMFHKTHGFDGEK